MNNMSTQWDETHLCSRYNESDCEFFLKTDAEIVFNGKKLDKCCYYCTSENKVRKIGTGGTWTGLSPKFCPKRKTAEKKTAEKQPSYIDKSTEPKIGDYVSEDMLGELLTFDELAEMEGQLVVANYSTESKNWYKVVQVGKTVEQKPDGRRLLFRDNPKKKGFECSIGEWAFKSVTNIVQAEKMWRLKQPADDKPAMTYLNKLREKYPKISETDEWLWYYYCPEDLLSGKNIPGTGNDFCIKRGNSCEDCWKSPCPADVDFKNDLEDFEADYFEQYPAEDTAEADAVPEILEEKSDPDKPPENQIIPQNAGEISETFNYAVLSAEMGDYLKHKEQQLKNEYMNFTANCGAIFAEAQEKLAKHGFGESNGLFEKWITSIGFNKQTVYNMISVYNFRSSKILTNDNAEIFDSLSKSLQYEIAKPSAPAELVEQVLNGDITTHKDYIALKKQFEEANKLAETERKARESIAYNFDNMEKGYVEFKDKYTDEYYKNKDLEKRIKELENRPVDVAVQRDETSLAEIDRLKNELAKAQQEILNASFGSGAADNSELLTELYETLHGSALSAIRSCADFAEKNGSKFTSRFRSLAEVINDYINEIEEF